MQQLTNLFDTMVVFTSTQHYIATAGESKRSTLNIYYTGVVEVGLYANCTHNAYVEKVPVEISLLVGFQEFSKAIKWSFNKVLLSSDFENTGVGD